MTGSEVIPFLQYETIPCLSTSPLSRGVTCLSQGFRDSVSTGQSILGGEAEETLLSEKKIDIRGSSLLTEVY